MTSSCESIQLISASIDVNSVACREVNDGSARNAGPDLEDLAEAGRLRHLLEELRALREVRGCPRSSSTSNSSARDSDADAMSLGVWISMKSRSTQYVRSACRNVVWTRKMRFCLRAAQVEEAPVHALVEARVGGDGRLGMRRGDDVERADLDLDAAELHALVVLELAGHA